MNVLFFSAFFRRFWRNLRGLAIAALLMLTLTLGFGQSASANLAQGDAITDPKAILRYALPIDNPEIRRIQGSLEEIPKYLKAKRWGPVVADAKTASRGINIGQDKILASIAIADQPKAQALLENLAAHLVKLEAAIADKDREAILEQRAKMLAHVGELEAMMVQDYPLTIPEEYANLPQLRGRATIQMTTSKGDLTIVVDGYNAPISAGNFVDLVQRGFYDGLPFIRAEDFYVLQTGDPDGPEEGFIDPKTKQYRAIPLEVLIRGDKQATYGATLEDLGIYLPDLALPFNAYGALAVARPSDDVNGGSSQFFFFKFDNEVTPPGFNLMDGRYSVFGYTVDGKKVLDELTQDDRVISAKVIEGAENLVVPAS